MERETWTVLDTFVKRPSGSHLRVIPLITAVTLTILYSILVQTSWAAVIHCPDTTAVCNGTSGDDIIIGPYSTGGTIHGLAGNDYIIGSLSSDAPNYIWGENGNDIIIGGHGNDGLFGGLGNDKYDGFYGDDTIYEDSLIEGSLVSNDDVISSGPGDDYIVAGEGSDKIHTGPGNDLIFTSAHFRDFSYDSLDCGSGSDQVLIFNSGDGDTAFNCEVIYDNDG